MLYFIHTLLRLTLLLFVVFDSRGKDTRKEAGRTSLRSSKRGGNRKTDCLGKNSKSSDSSHNANVTKYDIVPCISKGYDFAILVLCTMLCWYAAEPSRIFQPLCWRLQNQWFSTSFVALNPLERIS